MGVVGGTVVEDAGTVVVGLIDEVVVSFCGSVVVVDEDVVGVGTVVVVDGAVTVVVELFATVVVTAEVVVVVVLGGGHSLPSVVVVLHENVSMHSLDDAAAEVTTATRNIENTMSPAMNRVMKALGDMALILSPNAEPLHLELPI